MSSEPLDVLPLWSIFLFATAISMVALEVGYRFGYWRHAHASGEKQEPVAAMVGSILGLLAFMLAFTFSMAAARFDARRQVVLEEANAISTTYLRTRLLPQPQRGESANLLRQYTAMRVDNLKEGKVVELIARSEELHERLWSQAAAAAENDPHSIPTGLFLQSLNETIDLHSKRVFVSLHSRVPFTIWLSLFSLTLLGMASVGYQAGLSGMRRSPEMPVLTLSFAGVMLLIVDLDRGHEGLLRVSQQATIDLLRTMQAPHP